MFRNMLSLVMLTLLGTVLLGCPLANDEDYQFERTWSTTGVGVAVSPDGDLYVADFENDCVRKFSSSGILLGSFGEYGTEPNQLNGPRDIAIGQDGSIYVAEFGNARVQKFSSGGSSLGIWDNDSGISLNAIAIGADNSVYVAEYARIIKLSSNCAFVQAWGTNGTQAGQLGGVMGLAVSPDGNHVYASEWANARIQKFSSGGVSEQTWGAAGWGNGQFSKAYGVAVDLNGYVYVTEGFENHRVQKFTADGIYVTKWGGEGTANGQFSDPEGIAVAADGSVYVADTDNHRIQKFVPVIMP